jgi:hypothetical protein
VSEKSDAQNETKDNICLQLGKEEQFEVVDGFYSTRKNNHTSKSKINYQPNNG